MGDPEAPQAETAQPPAAQSPASGQPPASGAGRGAAALRASVTDKLAEAVLDELAETGYARMSMDAVARRAGAGKAAIYRRWESKQAMVLDVVADMTWQAVPVPNTGTLRGDVSAYVAHATAMRNDPRAVRLVADLTAEAARSPELARLADQVIRQPRRAVGGKLLERAMARWELSANLDPELALDCLVALAHARPQALGPHGELAELYPRERLVEVIMAALPACVRR